MFVELNNQSFSGKDSNHLKNIKTSLKNDPFHQFSMNNIIYFASILNL